MKRILAIAVFHHSLLFAFNEICPMPVIPNGVWLLITNSIVRELSNRIHVATYRCHEGYLEADVEDRWCSPDGISDTSFQGMEDVLPNVWSGKAPECIRRNKFFVLLSISTFYC